MAKSNKEYELAIKIAGQIDKSFTNSTGLTKKELRKIAMEAASASAGMKTSFKDGFKAYEQGFGSIEKGAKKAFDTVAKAAAIAGTAMTGAVAASMKVGVPFEAQMSTVEAISGATVQEMKILNDKAKEMGATTVFTATQAGEALEYMAMAGWKAESMLSGIEGVMHLAAASGEELGMVSDIVTDAMTAMKIPVEGTTEALGKDGLIHEVQNATHFADVLAAASASSNTNVAMLGESFKYCAPLAGAFGFELEDTALALGLMANSGIKASQSGTAFRKILTQLSSDFKVAQKDGTDFHVATVNTDGSMRSLKEILDDTREAFTGMSQAQKEAMNSDISAAAQELDIALTDENGTLKTQAELYDEITAAVNSLTEAGQVQEAEAIAGKTAMAGLLAIINASEEDYDDLYESIMKCNGAAEEMSKIRLNNLKGDYTIFTSGAEGLGIEAYEGMSELFRDAVQAATTGVNGVTRQLQISNAIPRFVDELQGTIPTAVRHLKDLSKSLYEFAEPLLKIGEWLLKNPTVIISTIAGIGGALVSFKVVQGVNDAAKAFKAFSVVLLNPFTAAIAIATVAIGVITGIAVAISRTNKEMKRQNLAEHFGEITLSLGELKEVAGEIIRTDSLGKVHEAMTAFEDLDGIKNNIEDSMKALKKLNWKVSIGMDLSLDDLELYENNVNQFIADNLEAVLQSQYSMSLVLDAFSNDDEMGQRMKESMNNFYNRNYQYLQELGEELGQVMADALQDEMLDIDEIAAIIELQNKMASITNALANSKMEAKLDLLELKYSGAELNPETLQNLQVDLNEYLKEATTNAEDAYLNLKQIINLQYETGDISGDEYEAQINELNKNYLDSITEAQLQVANFLSNTIKGQYKDEFSIFAETLDDGLSYALESIGLTGNGALAWSTLVQNLLNTDDLDEAARVAIADLFNQLQPTMEEMDRHAKRYEQFGMAVPEAIKEGITDLNLIGALGKDVDSIWNTISNTISTDEGYSSMLNEFEKAGNGIPRQIAEGMEKNKKTLSEGSKNLRRFLKTSLEKEFSNKIDLKIPLSVTATIPEGLEIPELNTRIRLGDLNMPDIGAFATGGIIKTPTLATFAEDGPEAAIPLDGSQNALNLWRLTGQLLGVYENPHDYGMSKAPESLESLYMGIKSGGTISNIDNSESKTEFNANLTYIFNGEAPDEQKIDQLTQRTEEDIIRIMEDWYRDKERKAFR